MLLSRRAELTARHAAALADAESLLDSRDVSQSRAEVASNAGDQVAVDRGALLEIAELNAEQLTEIDAALAALDAGTYGNCAACGHPIPLARLEARPSATLCVPCASQSTQRRR